MNILDLTDRVGNRFGLIKPYVEAYSFCNSGLRNNFSFIWYNLMGKTVIFYIFLSLLFSMKGGEFFYAED